VTLYNTANETPKIAVTVCEGVVLSIPKDAQILSPVDKEVDKEFCGIRCVDSRDSLIDCKRYYQHVTRVSRTDSAI
jgi:hypothetical protein